MDVNSQSEAQWIEEKAKIKIDELTYQNISI